MFKLTDYVLTEGFSYVTKSIVVVRSSRRPGGIETVVTHYEKENKCFCLRTREY